MSHNSTEDVLTERKSLVYAGLYGCILALGFPLNAVSLWILCCRHSFKSPSAVFMVNLATSDLLLVISLPLRVYFHATGIWPLNNIACACTQVLFVYNLCSSSIFITVISLDRMLAVVFPLRSRRVRTTSNAWKTAALTWVLVLIASIVESLKILEKLNQSNKTTCFQDNIHPLEICIFHLVLICSLLLVNIVSTALVTWTLNKLDHSKLIKNRVNVMMLFLLNFIMFSVFYLPLTFVFSLNVKKTFLKPLVCLACANCCVDPLLYYFAFDGFWKPDRQREPS